MGCTLKSQLNFAYNSCLSHPDPCATESNHGLPRYLIATSPAHIARLVKTNESSTAADALVHAVRPKPQEQPHTEYNKASRTDVH